MGYHWILWEKDSHGLSCVPLFGGKPPQYGVVDLFQWNCWRRSVSTHAALSSGRGLGFSACLSRAEHSATPFCPSPPHHCSIPPFPVSRSVMILQCSSIVCFTHCGPLRRPKFRSTSLHSPKRIGPPGVQILLFLWFVTSHSDRV